MDISKINKAAEILYNSRINLKRIEKLPKDCTPKTLKEAYDIQDMLVKKYLQINDNLLIGKKIGCTNKAAQVQLNINESFFGNMFSKNISKSKCIINSENYFSPFVEPEFSFVIKEELDIKKAPYKSEDVYKCISAVLPSIEIVDSRFVDWTVVGVKNLIADNAVHAHWIYGKEINNLDSINFNNHSVNLLINGKLIDKGNSNNVMENPINSLTWLINNMALSGKFLPKNSYISTGTCTPAIPIKKGDEVIADFGKLGNVCFVYK